MDDIVARLRKWFKDVNAVSAIDLMDEAAAEIERLRRGEWRSIADAERSRTGQKMAESDIPVAVCPEREHETSDEKDNDRGSVTPESYAKSDTKCGVSDTDRATLTDEEREAIAGAIDVLEQEDQWHAVGEARIKTLRKLLERLA